MLHDVQQGFRAAVLGGDDTPAAQFVRKDRQSRIAVYRNNVQASLTEVLGTAFPVVKRIVGEGFFAALARRFIAAAPPRLPQLSTYGDEFASFISTDAHARSLPYLPDVARLEWMRGETYFAADAPVLDPVKLSAVADVERVRFTAHPAAWLVRSAFPIHHIWEVNQPEVSDVPAVDMTIAESVVATRPRYVVAMRKISPGDGAFLAAVMEGGTLGEAAAQAFEIEPTFDLQEALRGHFVGGTFSDIVAGA